MKRRFVFETFMIFGFQMLVFSGLYKKWRTCDRSLYMNKQMNSSCSTIVCWLFLKKNTSWSWTMWNFALPTCTDHVMNNYFPGQPTARPWQIGKSQDPRPQKNGRFFAHRLPPRNSRTGIEVAGIDLHLQSWINWMLWRNFNIRFVFPVFYLSY